MIRSFADEGTEDVFNGLNTKAARRTCPRELWAVAGRKLDQLDSVESLEELRIPLGNRLEALVVDRRGQHSIRIISKSPVHCGIWILRWTSGQFFDCLC